MAHRRHVDCCRILGIDDYPADVPRLYEPLILPCLSAVNRFINAIPEGDTVSACGFTRAYPYDIRLGLSDGDIADWNRVLFVKNRRPGNPAILWFPDTARTDSGINDPWLTFHNIDIYGAASHHCGSDASPVYFFKYFPDFFSILSECSQRKTHQGKDSHSYGWWFYFLHESSSLWLFMSLFLTFKTFFILYNEIGKTNKKRKKGSIFHPW